MSDCIGKWTWDVSYEMAGKEEVHTFVVASLSIQGALAEAMGKIGKYVGTSECKIVGIQRRNQLALEEAGNIEDEQL